MSSLSLESLTFRKSGIQLQKLKLQKALGRQFGSHTFDIVVPYEAIVV